MTMQKLLFSHHGRIGRLPFLGGLLIFIVITAIAVRLSAHLHTDFPLMGMAPLLGWTLFSLLFKRLHDMNVSGWWAFLFLCIYIMLAGAAQLYFKYFPEGRAFGYVFVIVSIIGTLMKVVCFGILFLVPGTKGHDRYEA